MGLNPAPTQILSSRSMTWSQPKATSGAKELADKLWCSVERRFKRCAKRTALKDGFSRRGA
jgi:hypothetical protein